MSTPRLGPRGRSGWVERRDPGRRVDFERREDLPLLVSERRRLTDRAGRAGESDEVKPPELAGERSPGPLRLALSDADQKQRQPADKDVGADAVLEAVEHGTQRQGALQVAAGALCLEQVLLAEGDVLG